MAKFKFLETEVPGIVVVEPTRFADKRGFFMETWRQDEFAAAGIDERFVQDNHSKSGRGVLRGLHFQKENTQAKLVRVISGRVFDIGVDIRPNSPFFGRWAGVELNEENGKQLFVPAGFAHGFLVLSDEAEFVYKCSDYYNPAAEGGLPWNDPDIGVRWPDAGVPPQLSEKDAVWKPLAEQSFEFFERWYTS